jgi:hypothetical protein
LKGVLEVADIIDELKMIKHLLQTQREVLKPLVLALAKLNPNQEFRGASTTNSYIEVSNMHVRGDCYITSTSGGTISNSIETTRALAQGIHGRARDDVISTEETLVAILAGIDGIYHEANYTHRMVGFR